MKLKNIIVLSLGLSLASISASGRPKGTHETGDLNHQKVWLISESEAQILSEETQKSLDTLFQAVVDYEANFPLHPPAQRQFAYDTGVQPSNLERAAVSRILLASLDVASNEIANFAACGSTCGHHDVESQPESPEELQVRKSLWASLPTAKRWATHKLARTKDVLVQSFIKRRQLASYLGGQASYFRAANGVAATAAVAVTFPVYTFIAEKIETLLVGPVHFFCKASALGYFKAVNGVVGTVQSAIDAQSLLRQTDAPVNRAKIGLAVLKMRLRLSRSVRRTLFSTFIAGTTEAISRKHFDKTLGHHIEHQPALVQRTAEGQMWPDLVEQFFRSSSPTALTATIPQNQSLFRADLDYLFSSEADPFDKSARASEMTNFLYIIKDVMRTNAFYKQAAGEIQPDELREFQKSLGQMDRIIDKMNFILMAVAVMPPDVAKAYFSPATLELTLYQSLNTLNTLHQELATGKIVPLANQGRIRSWVSGLWNKLMGRAQESSTSVGAKRVNNLSETVHQLMKSGSVVKPLSCLTAFSPL